jgi:hypothetical protein
VKRAEVREARDAPDGWAGHGRVREWRALVRDGVTSEVGSHFSIDTNSIHVYSYIFSLIARSCTASWAWRSGTRRQWRTSRASKALTRRCLRRQQGARQERQGAHVTTGASIIFYVSSGLELKHVEKGKIALPWGDIFSPARAFGRRFYWGGWGCRGLLEAASAFA